MRHVIVGTAGHIDHGKTALIKALTGIDTDRLEEEKRRGISIDLGFAHLHLKGERGEELRIGFVDVPGHERFIRNMLAGASGIDMVLFVIAADESIRPQTREHFEICRMLGIRGGVVALTKSDLAGLDVRDMVRLEVEEFVAGSFLEGADIVAVSAATGEGLDELQAALARAASSVPGKDSSRYARLPIDRSFSMRGHGTVVTGTLISGSITLGDELELHPAGKRVRVRGLQVHGAPVERAYAGERTATNLAGIESSEARRGMTLAAPGRFRTTRNIDCSFELLPGVDPLKHRAPVHFHAGTAEVGAEARLIAKYVRFVLREPLLLLPGDRFIVRRFSPVTTFGGGVVIDIDAPAQNSSARNSLTKNSQAENSPTKTRREDLADRLGTLEHATPSERVALLVRESVQGASAAELVARTGLLEPEVRAAPGLVWAGDWAVTQAWAEAKLARLREGLAEYHKSHPLQPGWPKEDLRTREFPDAPVMLLDSLIESAAEIAAEGDVVRLVSHHVSFAEAEAGAVERVFEQAGLSPPPAAEALAKSGLDAARTRALLQKLLHERKLVRVADRLIYHPSVIASLRAMLAARKGARFSVGDFKSWTGLSRKHAIPLLEYFDREHVTRREGDQRVIL